MPNMRLFFGDNQSFRLFEPKTWVQNEFFPNTRKLQIFGARTEFGTELCSCVPKTPFSWKFAKKVCNKDSTNPRNDGKGRRKSLWAHLFLKQLVQGIIC